jgi:hypothetical protein
MIAIIYGADFILLLIMQKWEAALLSLGAMLGWLFAYRLEKGQRSHL